jgi:multiple antibiotic resistance protein
MTVMGFNYNDALSAFLILFAVIDIPGSIPIIVGLRKKVGHVQSEKATAVAGVIMIVFLFLGESILNLLGVDVQSFAIAGSFIIFFLALEMILGITLYKEESPSTASIVPIAFPLIAGAGTMTSLVSLQAEFAMINIIIAIVLNMIVVYAVLKNTERLERILDQAD